MVAKPLTRLTLISARLVGFVWSPAQRKQLPSWRILRLQHFIKHHIQHLVRADRKLSWTIFRLSIPRHTFSMGRQSLVEFVREYGAQGDEIALRHRVGYRLRSWSCG